MQEIDETCKNILSETITIIKDESFPIEFRESLKKEMLELKVEIDRIILEYE